MTAKTFGAIAALLLASYLAVRIFYPKQITAAAEEQAVIITIRLHAGDMGSSEERKRLFALEDQLAAEIEKSGAGEYDSNEFGEGTFTIYIYGPSAEKLFTVVQPILKKFNPPPGSYAIKRYGKPGARQDKVPIDGPETSKPK